MTRFQMILSGLLALQIVLIAVFGGVFGGGESASGERALLRDLDLSTVSRIEIAESDGDSITLGRENGAWVLEDFDGYPAENSKIENVLETLQELSVRRPVVTGSGYHESLEVTDENFQRRLRIWTANEDPDFDLIVGSSPTYRVHHVRLADEDPVYEIRGLDLWSIGTSPDAWIERNLVDIDADKVVALEWSNEQGTYSIRKEGEEWRSGNDLLDANEVDSFLRSASTVWIAAPVGRADPASRGLDPPTASVKLSWQVSETTGSDPSDPQGEKSGEAEERAGESVQPEVKTLTWMIGAEPPDDDARRFAAVAGSGYAVVVSESSVKKILETKAADLEAEAKGSEKPAH